MSTAVGRGRGVSSGTHRVPYAEVFPTKDSDFLSTVDNLSAKYAHGLVTDKHNPDLLLVRSEHL